jgi:hypothetical protein
VSRSESYLTYMINVALTTEFRFLVAACDDWSRSDYWAVYYGRGRVLRACLRAGTGAWKLELEERRTGTTPKFEMNCVRAGGPRNPDMRSLFSLLSGWNGLLSAALALRGCAWRPRGPSRL